MPSLLRPGTRMRQQAIRGGSMSGGGGVGPLAVLSTDDSVTVSYTHPVVQGRSYTAVLYDAAGTTQLDSQSSDGSGEFTVPSGVYQVGIRVVAVGPKSLVTTAAVVAGGSVAVPAPVHHWPLSEASGNRLDVKASPLTLTLTGTVGTGAGYRNALALQFPGNAANYLTATSLPVNIITTPTTIEFWLYPAALDGNNHELFCLGDHSVAGQTLDFTTQNNRTIGVPRPGIANYAFTDNAYVVGQWSHIFIVVIRGTPNTYKLYVNGELHHSYTEANALNGIAGVQFRIGRGNSFQSAANARLADMKWYDRELTASEIRGLSIAGIAPLDPYTGLAYPTSANRTHQMSALFNNRTHAFFLPPADQDDVTLPATQDWTASRLLRSVADFEADNPQVDPADILSTEVPNTYQQVTELTLGDETGTLYLTDGERVTSVGVVDPDTDTDWTSGDATELKARVTATFTACFKNDDARFPTGYFIPGGNYNLGQWDWDSWWAWRACATLGGAHIDNAKGSAKSKSLYQVPSGARAGAIPIMVPKTGGGAVDSQDTGPQQPGNALAILSVVEAEGAPDLDFVADVYPWLRLLIDSYNENFDADGSGLYSLSCTTSSGIADAYGKLSQKRADADGVTNDALWIDVAAIPADPTTSFRTTFCDPERSGLMAMEYTALATLSTLIGETADAATWTARAATIRAAVQSLMWDEAQKRFQWIERSSLARAVGTVAAASSGATTVTITSGTLLWLPAGCKLLLPGGVVAQPTATTELLVGVATPITLCSPLPGAVSAGSVTYRPFAEVDSLGQNAVPLYAECATQAQAEAVRDRLMADLDGEQSWECWWGSDLRGGRHVRSEWSQWCPHEPASSGTHNATDLQIDSGETGLRIGYRNVDGGNITFGLARATGVGPSMMFYHPDWERVDSSRPLTITVEWVKSGSIAPRVTVLDHELNQVVQQTLTVPAGADGVAVSATITVTATHLPGVVEIYASGGALKVRRVKIKHHVRGWMYHIPNGGLGCVPRVSRTSVAKPLLRNAERNFTTYTNYDYWAGTAWPPQVFWAVMGFHGYDLPEGRRVGSEYARRMLLESRAWNAWAGSDLGVWEWTGLSGAMEGSSLYCWGSLVWVAGREIGFIPAT